MQILTVYTADGVATLNAVGDFDDFDDHVSLGYDDDAVGVGDACAVVVVGGGVVAAAVADGVVDDVDVPVGEAEADDIAVGFVVEASDHSGAHEVGYHLSCLAAVLVAYGDCGDAAAVAAAA